jgi:hypothetical protein
MCGEEALLPLPRLGTKSQSKASRFEVLKPDLRGEIPRDRQQGTNGDRVTIRSVRFPWKIPARRPKHPTV